MAELELRRGIVARWKIEPKEGERFGVLYLERDPNPYAGSLGGGIDIGDDVGFLARYKEDPRYGGQYRVEKIAMHLPSRQNLVTWVLQRMPQIGPVRAKALQERFGTDIWDVIDSDPMLLTEVDGIGEERARGIAHAFQYEKDNIAAYTKLLNLGLDPRVLIVLLRKKIAAWELAQYSELDPYQLLKYSGIKFEDIDQLGRSRGIDKHDPRRVCGAVLHVLRERKRDGHTAVPYNVVRMEARTKLAIKDGFIDAGFNQASNLPFPAHFRFFGNRVQWGEHAEDERQLACLLGVDIGEEPGSTVSVETQIAQDIARAEAELKANPQWGL